MYYSPELVKALMEQRIFEAREARLSKEIEDAQAAPVDTIVGRLSRLLARPAAPTTVACPTC
jgi:hypothetical protein